MRQKSDFVSSIVLLGLADNLVPELARALSDQQLTVRSLPFPSPSRLSSLIDGLDAGVVFCAAEPAQYARVLEAIEGWKLDIRLVVVSPQPVMIERNASEDPRFRFFSELPGDRYAAFLSVPILCRERRVGVINLQNLLPHTYSPRATKLISTVRFLVGAEIEMARLESENSELGEQLKVRKLVERAKGILQRDFGLSEEEAYLTLQRQSRQRRKPMKEIAEAIVLAEELRRGQQQT